MMLMALALFFALKYLQAKVKYTVNRLKVGLLKVDG